MGYFIMRTTAEINNLHLAVTQALDILEPFDNYGYPTEEERVEMGIILDNLDQYQETGDCSDESVVSWLEGTDEYYLRDYLKALGEE